MKVIPVYLPQFHRIPENDTWWGEGFTEWVNVKKAKPLFEGHYQPRIPLDENYYDLTDIEALKWQCKLAKEHGIYGFCFYHYWFNGKLLLEKPMELLLAHPELDIRYCVSWANHNWDDGWKASAGNETTLISHDFDDEEDWVLHFNYLLQFFKDPRYISEDNKPLFIIYIPNIIGKLNKMLALWDQMAKDAGFKGLKFAFQSAMSYHSKGWDRSKFDYAIEFQPGFINNKKSWLYRLNFMKYSKHIKAMFGIKKRMVRNNKGVTFQDYDDTWNRILSSKPSATNAIPSAFVDWDNTPRKLDRGNVYLGASPEKFKTYFKALVQKTREEYKQDKIFVFAWNEWAEGGYLEPDEKFGTGYLRAIKDILEEENEIVL
ncbi:MAG: glycoside hydrolase family 99-like domain-containing protein [Salinivirgaceae bacterium]